MAQLPSGGWVVVLFYTKGMIILGIDPGTATTGFGVIRVEPGQTMMLDCGIISTPKDLPHADRLGILHADLAELIAHHKPDRAGLEKLFFTSNVTTAMAVSEARGVIILTLQQAGIELMEFTPTQIKQSTTGYGQAKKAQMQAMVQKILRLETIPKPDDAADALAIALAAAHSRTPR